MAIHSSQVLPQWHFNLGQYTSYSREPIELREQLPPFGRRPVVDDLITTHIQGAIGFTDWFEAGLNIPVTSWETYYDPSAVTPTKEKLWGLGDVRLETKFRLLNIERYHIGIGVAPFIVFPTVMGKIKGGKFAAIEQWSGGGNLIVEAEIKNRVWLSLNGGYQIYNNHQYYAGDPDAWVNDMLLLGFGANVRLTNEWFLIGEAYAETVSQGNPSNNPFKNPFSNERQTPVELQGAVRYQPQNFARGIAFTLGGGRGVTQGIGATDLRILFGLNWRKPKIVELPPPPAPGEVEIKGELKATEVIAKIEEKIVITQKIHFEFGKAIIRPISYPILNDVAGILTKTPHIRKVEIAGHCDWIGSDAYNLRLSQRRAQAVVDYLISRGVEKARLASRGYGESRPIADNNTVEGRAKNRRVEFTVLE